MITPDGTVKLLDFGAAREFEDEANKSLSVLLKHGYAPAEQYSTKGVQGPHTDVYALSATIYKAITGVTPESSMDRMMEDTLAPPSKLGVIIPYYQEAALMTGLAIRQNDRYQSVRDLYTALGFEHTPNTTQQHNTLSLEGQGDGSPTLPPVLHPLTSTNQQTDTQNIKTPATNSNRSKIVGAIVAACLVIAIVFALTVPGRPNVPTAPNKNGETVPPDDAPNTNVIGDISQRSEDEIKNDLQSLAENIGNSILIMDELLSESARERLLIFYQHDKASDGELTSGDLDQIRSDIGAVDLYITDIDGIIVQSTEPETLGFSYLDIWDGYRAVIDGDIKNLTSTFVNNIGTGNLSKYASTARSDNRGLLEIVINADIIIEKFMQSQIDSNINGINAINLIGSYGDVLTSHSADGIQAKYQKGDRIDESIITDFNSNMLHSGGSFPITNIDGQYATVYLPLFSEDVLQYVLFISVDITQIEDSNITVIPITPEPYIPVDNPIDDPNAANPDDNSADIGNNTGATLSALMIIGGSNSLLTAVNGTTITEALFDHGDVTLNYGGLPVPYPYQFILELRWDENYPSWDDPRVDSENIWPHDTNVYGIVLYGDEATSIFFNTLGAPTYLEVSEIFGRLDTREQTDIYDFDSNSYSDAFWGTHEFDGYKIYAVYATGSSIDDSTLHTAFIYKN
jgi:serine/threonine protein kinase